jgi:predicted DNA-binding antitoxin AbrB/MazE fold protein
MAQTITALYENGVLYPSTPLNLKEHQNVQVHIVPDSPQEEVEQVLHWLNTTGRITPPGNKLRKLLSLRMNALNCLTYLAKPLKSLYQKLFWKIGKDVETVFF